MPVEGVWYNEWDKPTAAWLKTLGDAGHIPSGHVETGSITDVRSSDISHFRQCHFFAGIGGWPLALRLAGYANLPCWTGSPPCQPFSVAGKGLAQSDERHLAPVWLDLIRECRPPGIFGEQVADAIKKGWLDDLFDALEREGYACGAAVLPACSVGAPHIRKRLFFGAVRLDHAASARYIRAVFGAEGEARDKTRVRVSCDGRLKDGMADPMLSGRTEGRAEPRGGSTSGRSSDSGMADAYSSGRQHEPNARPADFQSEAPPACECGDRLGGDSPGLCRVANPNDTRPQGRTGMSERADEQPLGPGSLESGSADPHHSFWSGADWLGCRDGKFRPVEPGTQPLAHGLPARVGLLRGYGNSINPWLGADFIEEFMNSIKELQ